jgi:hypothetical protein
MFGSCPGLLFLLSDETRYQLSISCWLVLLSAPSSPVLSIASMNTLALSHNSASMSLSTLPLLLFNHPMSNFPIPPSPTEIKVSSLPPAPCPAIRALIPPSIVSWPSLAFAFVFSAGMIFASSSPYICRRRRTSTD